jgi:Flp pilus assembly pilin Flp
VSTYPVHDRRAAARRHPAPGPDDADGQSMIEYGIIAALVAVVSMVAVEALGSGIAGVFTRILGRLGSIG